MLCQVLNQKQILNSFCSNALRWFWISIAFYIVCELQVNACTFVSPTSKTFFLSQILRFLHKIGAPFSNLCFSSIVCCFLLPCYLPFLGKVQHRAFSLFGEKSVAFRIRLRLGRVQFVLFVFQCGALVYCLFF